jgi:Mg-chelatase subunit ChlD
MPRSVRVAVGITSVFVAAWTCAACGSSSHPSSFNDGSSSTAGTGNGAGNGPSNGTGGSDGLITGMNGAAANGAGGNGGGAPLDACAAHVSTAQPIPLDIYMMLDTSASMLDATTATVTKWDAVKTAMTSFLNDSASAGLGVGLQYFPLTKPNAPTSCTSDADCGDSGPCFLKACYNAATITPCDTASDCAGRTGPCMPLGQCTADTSYVCQGQGLDCGPDAMNKPLGMCEPLTSSICESTDSCDSTQYAAPASAIAALPGAAAGLVASINAHTPAGATPTHAALSGAIAQASTWATAHPDHRVVVLLATDGLPTECIPPTATSLAAAVADVAAIAAGGVKATPSISTFVIGVFNADDVLNGAPTNLNEIAAQGGTTEAFIVDTTQDVTMQFLTALDTIRGAHLACEFQIPQPMAGQTLDYAQVNVQLTSAGNTGVVYYVANVGGCDATTGGWYYDVDPKAGTPTKIIACPTSCTAFQAATGTSSVGIALGCTTVVK